MQGFLKKEHFLAGIIVAFITFFIALVMSVGSQLLVNAINNLAIALILLFFIILLGILFDLIGTAVTAADIAPFNAMAAKKINGAPQAVQIVFKADVVANFCNDVVGDIAGTLSGALGAGIVIGFSQMFAFVDVVLASAVMTSLIAGLTVGGKAIGKKIALNNANEIILRVALLLTWIENITGWGLVKKRR